MVMAAATLVLLAGAPLATSQGAQATAVQCSLCAGGEFHPLTPTRVFDTRPYDATTRPNNPIHDVAPYGTKPLGPTSPSFDVQLLGVSDGPVGLPTDASDVLGVVVSIVAISPTQVGNLSVHAAGITPLGTSSILNFQAGQTVSNLAIVRPGSNGRITVHLNGPYVGAANVVVDVFGWFSSSSFDADTPFDPAAPDGNQADERGGRLIPVTPARLLDTRDRVGGIGAFGERESRALQIRGAGGVPDDAQVTGVVLNVVGVRPTWYTYLSVLPAAPSGSSSTSNVNLVPGQTKSNLVMAPVSPDGKVYLYNNLGLTEVVVDVMGYFIDGRVESTRAGRVVPLSEPYRVLDTRLASFGSVPLGPGQAESWSFANFAASVNIGGVSVGNQSALIGNLTNAALARQYPTVGVTPSYLALWPTGLARPNASNLNTVEGAAVPNMTVVKYGTAQQVDVYNARGYAHYLFDVSAVVLAD